MQAMDQHELWNGPGARAWIEAQDLLDTMFAGFETLLVAGIGNGREVLDIGCGTGATTLALARALAEQGRCAGVDISEPMIRVARERAAQAGLDAHFLYADAGLHRFCPDSFDLLVSRFGVMFFTDPVAAFANLRRAARQDARLDCFVWRSAAENPYMTAAERAASALIELPPRPSSGPGQFAFADPDHVRDMLEQTGWGEVSLAPADVPCSYPAAQLERYYTLLGPVGMALQRADAPTRARVVVAVKDGFAPFIDGDTVRFTAACWRIAARAN